MKPVNAKKQILETSLDQSAKFKAMTKELGTDGDEKKYDKTLTVIAKPNGKPTKLK